MEDKLEQIRKESLKLAQEIQGVQDQLTEYQKRCETLKQELSNIRLEIIWAKK